MAPAPKWIQRAKALARRIRETVRGLIQPEPEPEPVPVPVPVRSR
jgi:hypothetical protein